MMGAVTKRSDRSQQSDPGPRSKTMTNRTATTAAIILSLAAAGAPAASARPADYVPSRHQPATALDTRSNNSMIAVSPPATGSNAIDPSWVLSSLPPQDRDRVAALSALNDPQLRAALRAANDIDVPAARNARTPQAVVRAHVPQSGFDWGDAGIGAAGGLALSMIAVGGAFAVSQRRSRRSTALPS
jgi:hypothetical protein